MAPIPDACECECENGKIGDCQKNFGSFAVLDLETTGLMHLKTKISITELSIYGFPVEAVDIAPCDEIGAPVPERPRILHKLTLLFNPRNRIEPGAENVTGLSNYMLEHESYFDENAANTITNFLTHLKQPVCLIAHNGDTFDYPILKQSFEKIGKALPQGLYCVDSLDAFWDIDAQRPTVITNTAPSVAPPNREEVKPAGNEPTQAKDSPVVENSTTVESSTKKSDSDVETPLALSDNHQEIPISLNSEDWKNSWDDIKTSQEELKSVEDLPVIENSTTVESLTEKLDSDIVCKLPLLEDHSNDMDGQEMRKRLTATDIVNERQKLNESTPKRPTKPSNAFGTSNGSHARNLFADGTATTPDNATTRQPVNRIKPKCCRPLFSQNGFQRKRFPPKGVYKLGNIFERRFRQKPLQLHYAEADVDILMKLVQNYGADFVEYAERNAKRFS